MNATQSYTKGFINGKHHREYYLGIETHIDKTEYRDGYDAGVAFRKRKALVALLLQAVR